MSDFYDALLLKNVKSDFTHVSLDSENHESMIHSNKEVVDFDKVKELYVDERKLENAPKSIDGLFKEADDKYVFVEFKNGVIRSDTRKELREKAFHSIVMLSDICGQPCCWIRKHVSYVLVFNPDKNKEAVERSKKQAGVSDSFSFDQITSTVNSYAGNNYPMFDLNLLQKFAFEKVYSLSPDEFIRKFI